jgi:hypothetical protein
MSSRAARQRKVGSQQILRCKFVQSTRLRGKVFIEEADVSDDFIEQRIKQPPV